MSSIAIDLDNTTYSFEDAARQVYLDLAHERGDKTLFMGAYNPWQEWRSMSDVCGQDVCEEVITRVHSPEIIAKQRPFPGASDVLQDLAQNHELLYISNRDPRTRKATLAWLLDWGFPAGELICTFDDKIPLVSQCQYIIDDRPKTLIHFIHDFTWRYSRGPKDFRLGFGLAYPYNQALTDIPRVYLAPTWGGLAYYLQEKGVLSGSQDRNGPGNLKRSRTFSSSGQLRVSSEYDTGPDRAVSQADQSIAGISDD